MKKTILFFLMLSSLIFGSINSEYVDAFEIGDISLIKKLLNKGANINTINYEGSSALTLALKNNRRDLAKFLIEKGITVAVSDLADSSVKLVVRAWAKTPDYWDVKFGLTEAIKLRFDEEGISIPFPQQDVHHYNKI